MKNWRFVQTGNAKQVYSDADLTIMDDGTVKISYFPGYTQDIKDVPSIVRDEITSLKNQIAELERVEKKAKEFKSKIGNAEPKVTDISGKDGSGVVERMSNQFFVSYKLNNGEKGIEKFPTEAQAVEFLKKKVGNDATAEKLGLKPAPFNPNQLKAEDEKKVKDLFHKNGGDYEKTIKDIKAEYKSLPEDGIRRMLYNLVGVPQKAKNESIDKQEWSMFKGLGKDAEKEIGNVLPPSGLYAKLLDEICEKEGIDLNKAREKYGQYSIEQWEKLLGRKIGNASASQEIRDEYNAEIYRLERKVDELERKGRGFEARKVREEIRKLQRELRELGNKKTVNARYGSDEDVLSHLDTDLYEIHQRLKQKDESPWRYLSELQKKGYDMGTLSRHNKDIGKIIEKLKTGNETKAEEKFGKVMGEFEEGALKTPQGKTVTDPDQAKAIAYSEADKVDNLKRARNAINKKK